MVGLRDQTPKNKRNKVLSFSLPSIHKYNLPDLPFLTPTSNHLTLMLLESNSHLWGNQYMLKRSSERSSAPKRRLPLYSYMPQPTHYGKDDLHIYTSFIIKLVHHNKSSPLTIISSHFCEWLSEVSLPTKRALILPY